MKDRQRILFLTCKDPLDLSYGGGQRTHFIWKSLQSCDADVETVVTVPHLSQEGYDEVHKIRRICFEKRLSLSWLLLRLNQKIFKRFLCPGLVSGARLRKFYPKGFDKVVVRYPYMASYLKTWKIAPMILDVDDVPTQSFDTNWLHRKGLCFWIAHHMLKMWQDYIFRHASILLIANPDNRSLMPKGLPVCVLPNIPREDHDDLANEVSNELNIFHMGCLAGQQKEQGLDYVLSHYWPTIHEKFPSLTFKIAGSHLPPKFKARWSKFPNVEVLGFVDSVNALYKHSRAMLAVMTGGAGTSIRVLECLSYGRVCIGTPFAWRGYEIKNSAAITYNNLDDLVKAIELISNSSKLLTIQQNAASAIRDKYSFKSFEKIVHWSVEVSP